MGEGGVNVLDHLRYLRVTNLELAQRIKVDFVDGTAGRQNRDMHRGKVGGFEGLIPTP